MVPAKNKNTAYLWEYMTHENIQKTPIEKLAADYEKMYKLAKGRLKRLAAAGYRGYDPEQRLRAALVPPVELTTKKQYITATKFLSATLRSGWTTPGGIREGERLTLEKLKHDNPEDFGFLNQTNIHDFLQFMQSMSKAAENDIFYDSYDSIDVFKGLYKRGVRSFETLPDDFEWWLEKAGKIEKLPQKYKDKVTGKKKAWTAELIRKELTKK